MSEVERLQAECNRVALLSTGVVMRTEATLRMFDGAAFLAQGEELDNIRLQLHALLDEKLDHSVRLMQLTRQLLEL